ncbi:LamG-like jellyroll fold domain-containing protein [Rufibacter psychrotolerans]|uniref:LamG-like jellyroll fold domain-containing protein n=1 Tax=Rufibacter psychrotolerans TaxID=2812556 RepID=UPI0019679F13|nr:LamG-like jellyroll fold domain-containing protein [Rufibacter sp. SYSU D00308]
MQKSTPLARYWPLLLLAPLLFCLLPAQAQTLAFPGAKGFGRFAQGARGAATQEVYVVTNLKDSGPGSFREAVSKSGRIVVFSVSGIIHLQSDVVVPPNTTIAGQTAPGEGIVLFNKRVTFSSSSNTICRYLRIRLGATGNAGKDASGLSNGSNMIFDHMSFTWGMDEVFSINWDGKGTSPDNITVQNSIIGQGLHRDNHSAGGLIQTPDGGKISLIRNLYISNKTRNPKVKGVNEFVNNVVYDWGNGNRLADNLNYGWSGDAYIMGGSSGVSEVNIINNYFVGGPLTPPNRASPFSRGTGSFFLYGAGNYYDNNKNGVLDGTLVPYDASSAGYPGIAPEGFKAQPFPYPMANPTLTAEQAYQWVIDSVGASYPRRDQVDAFLIDEVKSRGTKGHYVYRETDLPLSNGGLGEVFSAEAPLDTDQDGMPDAWEEANGLDKNNKADAVAYSATHPQYLNIEVYVNSLESTPPPAFIRSPSEVTGAATSAELPSPSSQVVLNWKDNSAEEDYFLLERSEDGVTFTQIAQLEANATTYTDHAGLLPNKTYHYRLKAVSGTEASAFSAPVSIKTPALPTAPAVATSPSPGNGFQQVELTAGTTTLRWTGSSNTVTYTLHFGTSPENLAPKAELAYVASPSYEITGLEENATYYWRIDATNEKGTSDGEVWSFRTVKSIPPQLVGHYSFDETEEAGTQITDSSAFENHGVLGLDDDDQSIRVAGKVNNALDFATASTDRYVVSVPNQDQLFLDKSSFTLSFWMKANPSMLPQDNNTSSYLLCKGSITRNATTGATGKRFDIEFKNKQIRFAIDDDVNKDELQASGLPFFTGDWVHVVAIRDAASKKLLLYLNGSLVKEQTGVKAVGIGEASALIIGNIGELEFLSSANQPAPYKGMLDDLKIFNYSLTDQEVMALHHTSPLPLQAYDPSLANNTVLEGFSNADVSWKGGLKTDQYKVYLGTDPNNLSFLSEVELTNPTITFSDLVPKTAYFWRVDAVSALGTTTGSTWTFKTGNPKGLVGHWKLDETTGTVAQDNSNYQHAGTLTNMANAEWTTPGKIGGGLAFNTPAATGSVVIPHTDHLLFDQNAFTISMWVKIPANTYTSSTGGDTYLLHKGTFEATTGKWYGLQLRDGNLVFAIDDGKTKTDVTVRVSAAPYHLFTNTWKNIIAVRDTEAKQIRLYIDGVLAGSKAYTTGSIGKATNLTLGNSTENKPYRDALDDVRLYNYALSPADIALVLSNTPLVAKTTAPSPANAAMGIAPDNITLGWEGEAQTFKVYAGTTPENLALQASVTQNSYQLPGAAALGNYFWRVDAVRDGEVATGDVWSFVVQDLVPPTASAKDISVTLAANGQAVITPADVDNGSSDQYGIASLELSQTTFGCGQLGANQVTLTVTDTNGNVSTAQATVTVLGEIPAPAIAVSRENQTFTGTTANTVVLGYGAQSLTLTASNPTSAEFSWSPEVGLSTTTGSQTVFTPTAAGTYTFEVTTLNEYGCSATETVTVTVLDARCANNKVVVCHNGKEICIDPASVQDHLSHGCQLGSCTSTLASNSLSQTQAEVTAPTLSINPNPVSNKSSVQFAVPNAGHYSLEVYDMKGSLVKTLTRGKADKQQLQAVELDAANLQSGVYLLKLVTETSIHTKRFVVEK